MGSSFGNDTASAIVVTDTIELINQADSIVSSCTGTNCNTSPQTQTSIIQQLSSTAQSQANTTINLLGVPATSITARNIRDGYLNLGSTVAFSYNYQCGATTVGSTSCVENSTTVQSAQDNLANILLEPSTTYASNIIILGILAAIGIIAFFIFFIFFIIAIVESFTTTSVSSAIKVQESNYRQQLLRDSMQPHPIVVTPQLITTPNQVISPPQQEIPMPVSPFDITEPVYK